MLEGTSYITGGEKWTSISLSFAKYNSDLPKRNALVQSDTNTIEITHCLFFFSFDKTSLEPILEIDDKTKKLRLDRSWTKGENLV